MNNDNFFAGLPSEITSHIVNYLPLTDAISFSQTNRPFYNAIHNGLIFKAIKREQAARVDSLIRAILQHPAHRNGLNNSSNDPDIELFLKSNPTTVLENFKRAVLAAPDFSSLLIQLKTYRSALAKILTKLDYLKQDQDSFLVNQEVGSVPYLFSTLDAMLKAIKSIANDSDNEQVYIQTLAEALGLIWKQGDPLLLKETLKHWVYAYPDEQPLIYQALSQLIQQQPSFKAQAPLLTVILNSNLPVEFLSLVDDVTVPAIYKNTKNNLKTDVPIEALIKKAQELELKEIAEFLSGFSSQYCIEQNNLMMVMISALLEDTQLETLSWLAQHYLTNPPYQYASTILNVISAFNTPQELENVLKSFGQLRKDHFLGLQAENETALFNELSQGQALLAQQTFTLFEWITMAIFKHRGEKQAVDFIIKQRLFEPYLIDWLIKQVKQHKGNVVALQVAFKLFSALSQTQEQQNFASAYLQKIFYGLNSKQTAQTIAKFIKQTKAPSTFQTYLINYIEEQVNKENYNFLFYLLKYVPKNSYLSVKLAEQYTNIRHFVWSQLQKGVEIELDAKLAIELLQEFSPIDWSNPTTLTEQIGLWCFITGKFASETSRVFILKHLLSQVLGLFKQIQHEETGYLFIENLLNAIINSYLFYSLEPQLLSPAKELFELGLTYRFDRYLLLKLLKATKHVTQAELTAFQSYLFVEQPFDKQELSKVMDLIHALPIEYRLYLENQLVLHALHYSDHSFNLSRVLLNAKNLYIFDFPVFALQRFCHLYPLGLAQPFLDATSKMDLAVYQELMQAIFDLSIDPKLIQTFLFESAVKFLRQGDVKVVKSIQLLIEQAVVKNFLQELMDHLPQDLDKALFEYAKELISQLRFKEAFNFVSIITLPPHIDEINQITFTRAVYLLHTNQLKEVKSLLPLIRLNLYQTFLQKALHHELDGVDISKSLYDITKQLIAIKEIEKAKFTASLIEDDDFREASFHMIDFITPSPSLKRKEPDEREERSDEETKRRRL